MKNIHVLKEMKSLDIIIKHINIVTLAKSASNFLKNSSNFVLVPLAAFFNVPQKHTWLTIVTQRIPALYWRLKYYIIVHKS